MDKELQIVGKQEPRCMHSAVDAIYEGKPYTFGLKQNPNDCVHCSWYALQQKIEETDSWKGVQIFFNDDQVNGEKYIAECFPDGMNGVQGKADSLAAALRALINEITDFWLDQENQ